jgi:hypothetical protein
MYRFRSLALAGLFTLLHVGAARADSPISSGQIQTEIDNIVVSGAKLGSAFAGQSYTVAQAKKIADKLISHIGSKENAIAEVFDNVQYFAAVLFNIGDSTSASHQKALKYYQRKLSDLSVAGRGGMNAAAAKNMFKVFYRMFFGSMKGISQDAAWKELAVLQKATNNPMLDVVMYKFNHYRDAFGAQETVVSDAQGATASRTDVVNEAVNNMHQAIGKLLAGGNKNSYAKEAVIKALEYGALYQGRYGHFSKLKDVLTAPAKKLSLRAKMQRVANHHHALTIRGVPGISALKHSRFKNLPMPRQIAPARGRL